MVTCPLAIRLKPFIRLAVILGFAYFAAIGMLWPLTLPPVIKLMDTALLAVSLFFYSQYYALLRLWGSVVAFERSDEMSCALETRRSGRIICMLLGSSFVAPYLTALNLKPSGGFFTPSVVILGRHRRRAVQTTAGAVTLEMERSGLRCRRFNTVFRACGRRSG
jgi:hypothetical protein